MHKEFIAVSEAKQLILANIESLPPVQLPLSDAAALVLAEDLLALINLPPFNQASMDGYALNFEDWQKHKELLIDGESQAGLANIKPLAIKSARRIFTGAAIPQGADTVVMQEKTKLINGVLSISDMALMKGQNVRIKGSEAKENELALEKNAWLSPAAIGFIAGLGIEKVMAYPQPSVSIILTGNELQQPGKSLQMGQVYDANSFTLKAALNQLGIFKINILSSKDNLKQLSSVLKNALDQSDLILLTGGVSVGDYDFVVEATQKNEVEQIFHKIKQKPGKPLFFGKKGKKYIFGLPGNPASVLSCFYEYVYPSIGLMNNGKKDLIRIQAPLSRAQKKSSEITQFLKGFFDGVTAHDLKAQESFRLSSFAKANCIIKLEEGKTEFAEGELVEIHLLPF
jgi:molybdopterin molybdotransferase